MPTPETAAPRPARRDVDLSALAETLFATRRAQLGWFLLVALLTRVSTFGDPNYHNDELLFLLVGQRMHDGLLPYVDIWDRKGPGLFLVYYLITGISRTVVAYQLVATLFAALTALAIAAIATRFSGRLGAMLAGTLYLLMLTLFAGSGGQAPVFYNLFVALAALGVIASVGRLRVGAVPRAAFLAMAGAGVAITFKQTAVFEGAMLGCIALWHQARGGMRPLRLMQTGLGLTAAGAAPFAVFALFYAITGHFAEFWHAMVTANLSKAYNPGGDAWSRVGAMALIASPLLVPAAATLVSPPPRDRPVPRGFLATWIAAALVGLAIIPNFIDHYALPVLVPLSVAAAPALDRRGVGPAFALVAAIFALMAGPAFAFGERQASRAAFAALVTDIRARDPHPRLFVYQGPPYLYSLFGSYPPTPLLFPTHLFTLPERNTSYLDTAGEVRKILAWKPTVVVTAHHDPGNLVNRETEALVTRYRAGCRWRFTRTIIDIYGPQQVDVWGDCGAAAAPERTGLSKFQPYRSIRQTTPTSIGTGQITGSIGT